MKQLRRIISFALVLTMLFGMIPPSVHAAPAHPFSDVPEGKYYSEAAAYMYDNGLIKGTTATTFSPMDVCTRAMVVTILWRMEGEPESVMIETPFTDLTKNWYKNAVRWANENGIVNGMDSDSFNPDGSITREQLATILYRYCSQYKGYNVSDSTSLDAYPDLSKVGKFAREGLSWAVASGLINGSNNNGTVYLDPKGNATRAQVATILMRFLKDVDPYLNGSVDCTVSFETNGGTAVPAQSVEFGQCAIEPIEPTRDGYIFAGWCTNEALENPWFFNLPVEHNVTLYAKWVQIPQSATFTRGQWLEYLLELNEFACYDYETENIPFFANTYDSPYRDVVETAYAYQILPGDLTTFEEWELPVFDADEIATREFAAYTTTHALGFTQAHMIDVESWEDYDALAYPDEDAVAIAWNMLKLENGYFHPNEPVDSADAALIAAAIELVHGSSEVTEDEAHEIVRYAENTLRLSQLTDYEVIELGEGNYRAILPGVSASAIAPGTVLILPANDVYYTGIALKVVSISAEENAAVAQCVAPELQEVYSRLDYAGQPTFIEACLNEDVDDGVEVKYIPAGQAKNARTIYGGVYDLPEDIAFLEFTLKEKDFHEKIKGDITVTVAIPEITAIVNMDIDKVEIYDVLFKVKKTATINGKIEASGGQSSGNVYYDEEKEDGTLDEKIAERIELKRVPFQLGTTGLSADLVFYFAYSLKGEITIEYELECTTGFVYTNWTERSLESIENWSDTFPTIELNASASAGIGVAAELNLLHLIDLMGYFIELGLGVNGKYNPRFDMNPFMVCGEVSAFVYLKHGLDKYTILGEILEELKKTTNIKLDLEFDVLKDDDSNPLHWETHTENMKWVDECTYGTGGVIGTVTDVVTDRSPTLSRIDIYKDDHFVGFKVVANGKFEYKHLSPGDYTLRVSADGYYPIEFPITITKGSTLNLNKILIYYYEDFAKLSGSVYCCEDLMPLENAVITVYKGFDSTEEVMYAISDEDGLFDFIIERGDYHIVVTCDGYTPMKENVRVYLGYPQSVSFGLATQIPETEPTEPKETEPEETGPLPTEPEETKPIESEPTETEPTEPNPEVSGSAGLGFKLSSDETYYILSDDSQCTDSHIVVPTHYNGLPVKEIQSFVFASNKTLAQITIPEGIEIIGSQLFDCCPNLKEVHLPASVNDISGSFTYMSSIEVLTVDEDNPVYYSSGNCIIERDSKILVNGCKGSVVPTDEGIVAIGPSAFNHTGITEIEIPNTVTVIYDSAFLGCDALERIVLSNQLTLIENYAFEWCRSLTSIEFPESLKEIKSNVFSHSGLKSVIIPEGVEKLGNMPFNDCDALESIHFPSTLTQMGVYYTTAPCLGSGALKEITVAQGNPVFHSNQNCLILTASKTLLNGSVNSVIPDDGSVTVIGGDSFTCMEIDSITIPGTIETVEYDPFLDSSLKNLYYEGTMEQWMNINERTAWEYTINCSDGIISVTE